MRASSLLNACCSIVRKISATPASCDFSSWIADCQEAADQRAVRFIADAVADTRLRAVAAFEQERVRDVFEDAAHLGGILAGAVEIEVSRDGGVKAMAWQVTRCCASKRNCRIAADADMGLTPDQREGLQLCMKRWTGATA